MKKNGILIIVLAITALLSCCTGKQKFEDPEMQANYEKIALAMDENDWEALTDGTNWTIM